MAILRAVHFTEMLFLHYLSSLLSYYKTIEASNCLLLLNDFGLWKYDSEDVKDGVTLNRISCWLPNSVKLNQKKCRQTALL